MIPYIPHGTTYKDLLQEFVFNCYVRDQQTETIAAIKNTFKRITSFSINELVSDANFQQVIDTLSNAKIPHCTFGAWLRKYEWKTPQQSENGLPGVSYDEIVSESEQLSDTPTTTEPDRPQQTVELKAIADRIVAGDMTWRELLSKITDYPIPGIVFINRRFANGTVHKVNTQTVADLYEAIETENVGYERGGTIYRNLRTLLTLMDNLSYDKCEDEYDEYYDDDDYLFTQISASIIERERNQMELSEGLESESYLGTLLDISDTVV